MRISPFGISRRVILASGLATMGNGHALPAKPLSFPRDHGSHPGFRGESWQLTGHGKSGASELGFQVTFFRARSENAQRWHAHASVTDVRGKKFFHDQRSAGSGGADLQIDVAGWSLKGGAKPFDAVVKSPEFGFALALTPLQPVLLQGERGLAPTGPDEKQARYQYSLPQMAVQGLISIQGQDVAVQGRAWLEHEWHQDDLHPQAAGRDWMAMNLFDGSSVTAFQIRDRNGQPLWDGGAFRTAKALRFGFRKGEVVFSRQKIWKSRVSQASYPVEWIVRTPADFYTVRAVIPNQELDSRPATGGIYWTGLSDLYDSNGNHVGRGHLEMTGYAQTKLL